MPLFDQNASVSPTVLAPFGTFVEYVADAAQRSVLFWDVMRQRGNQYREHICKPVPHVLDYKVELVADGRTFEKPVNYGLVRIVPPDGIEIDLKRRPFVIVDPRAGHGPGIGGFKADSEIGVALEAGHPCYFIGFSPDPVPGQTIGDIARAEAIFLEKVIARHPQAEGKPCVIGNCQAGWAVMMLAAVRPELFGPLIAAGSPLSYWAGASGQNPMRYTGGLLGGSWVTALMSDLGHGVFDGAWLVENFESLDPANTLWSKPYNLYSKIDTEAPRYLHFERWWGGHVNLNAEEIQFIVDELFIGNKLAPGKITTSDGVSVDLRNIRSPILVFCSEGDNITPPSQALGWILDLYKDVDEIRSYGQTIIYCVHTSVGHLGIFVSGRVARKEHEEFSSNIDMIDVLPPGLYEVVFEPKTGETTSPDLVIGNWVMRCELRTLDDIRAMGGHDANDEHRFATVARLSEVNLALYRTYLQPLVRACVSSPMVSALRQLHPLRLQYELLADSNPLMAPIHQMADWIREHRSPVGANNPFLALQDAASRQIVATLDAWRDLRDGVAEWTFRTIYSSPFLQAAAGIQAAPSQRAPDSLLHQELLGMRIAELKSHIGKGGVGEALMRAALYIGMSRGGIDERSFEMIRRIRLATGEMQPLTLAAFKALVREQYLMLLIEEDAALAAISSLLPSDYDTRHRSFAFLKRIVSARGEMEPEAKQRLQRVAHLFGLGAQAITYDGSQDLSANDVKTTQGQPI